jgi:hypothetical protein
VTTVKEGVSIVESGGGLTAMMATAVSNHIRKKGFGPKETQVALGVSRDSKDIKD